MDIIKKPWKKGLVDQRSLMGKLAPEITTVSNPNKKPDKAATRIHLNDLGIKFYFVCGHYLSKDRESDCKLYTTKPILFQIKLIKNDYKFNFKIVYLLQTKIH